MKIAQKIQDSTMRLYANVLPHAIFKKYKQIILYGIFGVSAAILDLGTYLVLFNFFGVNAILANTVSIFFATILGFFLNAIINFGVKDYIFFRFLSYAFVSFIGYVVSSLMIYYFYTKGGFDGNVIKVLSLPVIFVLQYILNSIISFRKHTN